MTTTENKKALLSNDGCYTIFRYGNQRLKIIAPYSLEYYTDVREWDKGYIVVMAKYKHNKEPQEEYIDLIPVFEALMLNKNDLEKIDTVEVCYDDDELYSSEDYYNGK